MSALLDFLQRNQITSAAPLPLVHTTEAYYLKRIAKTGKLETRRCEVFKDKLSYFFVGRAAYKREHHREAAYWELPACLVLDFSVDQVKRVHPFDTGAFKRNHYPPFIKMMSLADFEVSADQMAVPKLIGTFFANGSNYYNLRCRSSETFETMFDVDVLDEEIKAVHSLIQSRSGKADDRRFAIELQVGEDIVLKDRKVLAVVLPETYLQNDDYIERVKALGGTVITYPVYPLRKDYFYWAIYLKLDEFYKSQGFYK